MTVEEIRRLPREHLTAFEVAPLLGTDPNTIRWQARRNPAFLGFPVICMKSRVKIPKRPFLQFMLGEDYQASEEEGSTNEKA